MATPTKPEARMTIEEFARTIEAAPLTPKMRKFVLAYVRGFIDAGKFDALAAAKVAYVCKSDQTARCIGYQLLANPKIVLAVNQFFGLSQKEGFLRRLERAIYDKDITIAQVRALELTAQANGWTTGLPRHQDLRVKPPKSGAKNSKVTPADPLARVPEGATPLVDKAGVLRGYRTAEGQYVPLADIEVR